MLLFSGNQVSQPIQKQLMQRLAQPFPGFQLTNVFPQQRPATSSAQSNHSAQGKQSNLITIFNMITQHAVISAPLEQTQCSLTLLCSERPKLLSFGLSEHSRVKQA